MFREKCKVLENKNIAPGHTLLKLTSAKISKNATPGQFVQILCADSSEPLLPRPFSFLSASKNDFSILFQEVGKGTKILSQVSRGDSLWVLGPLGNGFTVRGIQKTEDRRQKTDKRTKNFILAGGGVGIPPLYHLTERLIRSGVSKNNIHVFLGARNKSLLLCEKQFRQLGAMLYLTTDDGSKGKKGFVTEILDPFIKNVSLSPDFCPPTSERCLPSIKIYTCGPTPMLKAVSLTAAKYRVPCEVSVEVPMACGFGACLGCAIKVRSQKTENRGQKTENNLTSDICHQSSEHRFAMACCEGPVFEAGEILWE